MKKSNFPITLIAVFFLVILLPLPGTAQRTDIEAGLMNIGVGSIIGGIGAVINKKPEEKIMPVLLKGAGSGALGGYLIFESKRLVRLFSEDQNYGYIWPSKIVQSAGSSIIENAAANRDFWKEWHMNIGFNRIELTTGEGLKIKYRIMPVALVGTIVMSQRGSLDIEKSLKTGNFVFTTGRILPEENEVIYGQMSIFGNSILILDNWEGEAALAHELIHVAQNESFVGTNTFYTKPLQKLSEKNSFFRLYSKIFYTDLHNLAMGGLYNYESWQGGYSGNIFEEEAFYFVNKEMKNPVPPKLSSLKLN